MSRKLIQISFFILLLSGLVLGLAIKDGVQARALQDEPNAKIEGMLLDKFATDGKADFIVDFTEKADLSAAYSMDWEARGHYVYDTLTATAAKVQAQAKSTLEGMGFTTKTFIAGNELYVFSGSLDAANVVAAMPEVSSIRATRVWQIDPGTAVRSPVFTSSWAGELLAYHATFDFAPDAITDWGITDSKADQFWSAFGIEGSSVVVANIDTGVDYTHIALNANYKCVDDPSNPECWLDPAPVDCTGPEGGPCDTIYSGIYHGTHTMGTMVANNDPSLEYIAGMAPDAQWIACRGCPSGSCPDFDLNSCADWILAPGDNPDARPNIVNNSWGGGGGNNWYLPQVQSWVAAGVFPAFSAGNSYSCNSLGSPGDYQESFGSASHQVSRAISDFSSKGPSVFGDDPYTKPNISAPGENIWSTQPNNGWASISGTSMASPHTAGAVALLWSCNPSLVGQIDQTFQILQDNSDVPPAGSCGAPTDGEGNYTFGYGYLDILAAGYLWCGDLGTIDGHVVDAVGGGPIEGATVHGVGDFGGGPTAVTDQNGYYTMDALVGLYDVTASHPHFMADTINGVEVFSGTTTTVDFDLTPRGWVFGYVTDFDNETPIEGATVSTDDGQTTATNAQGYYEIYLDPGTHTVTAVAPDYAEESAQVEIVSGVGTQQDFALQAAVVFVPSPIDVNVPLGDQLSVPATIFNRMPDPYNFEFREKNGGYQPAANGGYIEYLPPSPAVSPDLFTHNGKVSEGSEPSRPYRYHGSSPSDLAIIVYSDDDQHEPDYVVQALESLGLSFTHYGNPADPAPLDQFTIAVNAGGWDLVILAQDGWVYNDAREYTAVNNYLVAGGTAIVHSWGIGLYPAQYTSPLWTTMGVTFNTWITTPESLYWWDPTHPLFSSVPEFTDLTNLGYLAYGAEMTVIDGVSTSLGGFTASPTPGRDGVVLRDDSLSLYKGLTDNLNSADLDADGAPDAYEFWVNAIGFILNPNIEVPWLSEEPISGTVPADGSLPVTISFDASPAAGVTQPGTYTAELTVVGQPKVSVPVSMFVEAPADWGRLDGTVTGLGYCDQNPAVLEGATVEIVGEASLTTDALGYYATWLPAGTYTVNVTAAAHTTATAQVTVVAQGNTTQDFDLRWLQPCMSEAPTSLESTLGLGETDTQQFTLTNDGAGVGTFEISDSETGYTPVVEMQPLVPTGKPIVPAGSSSNAAVQPFLPRVNDFSILELTTTDTSQSLERALTELGYAFDSIYVPPITGIDFSPYDVVFLAMDGGLPSYADVQTLRTEVIDAGKKLIFFGGTCVQSFAQAVNDLIILNDVNQYCWQVTNPPQWTLFDPSNPLADGLPDSYNFTNMSAGFYSQRVTDPEAEQVAINGENWPSFLRKSTDGEFLWFIDSAYSYYWTDPSDFALLKQLVSNAIEVSGGGDALWLTEQPITGTVGIDGGTQAIDVIFDAGMVTQPGTYSGLVKARTNDPVNKDFTVSVTMTVSAPADWGMLSGTVISLGYCDENPAPIKRAQVQIVGGLTLETDSNGHYSLWLQEGTYDVIVTADEHLVGTATVVVLPGGEITVQDFSLRWMKPCLSVAPTSFDASLNLGETDTQLLTITNSGAGDLNWKTTISNGDYQPLLVNEVLVVAWDTTAATSMETALTSLGVTYDQVDTATFDGMTVDQLLEYSMVFYAGIPFDFEQNLLIAYLDAGGRLYVSDNDVGYSISASVFYQTYLQASYIADHGGEILDGTDLMSGITVDVTGDPYPDSFTVGAEGVQIFTWQGGVDAGGDAIERGSYKAVYTSFDFQYISSPDVAVSVVENILGFLGGGEVTWLYTTPTEGTIPADSTETVEVTFDAMGLTQPGTYTANLNVRTDDPINPHAVLPATLVVIAPANYGMLSGTVNSRGYCDINPAPLPKAEVCIEGQMCLDTGADGSYLTWLPAGEYNVSVTADGHVGDLAGVIVNPGGAITEKNFDLRLIAPCTSIDPQSFEVDVAVGMMETVQLTLSNDGAGATAFNVKEKETGLTGNTLDLGFADPNYTRTNATSSSGPVPEKISPQASTQGNPLTDLLVGPSAYGVDANNANYYFIPDVEDPAVWQLVGPVSGKAFFAGDFINGDFSTEYALDYYTNSLFAIDTATAAQTLIGSSVPGFGESWTGMTASQDGTMYASASACGSSSTLYTVDLSTGGLTTIGTITNGACIIDIAMNADGDLYGVDIVMDQLVKIDPATGSGTVIGSLGYDGNYAQGLDFDKETGILYWASCQSQFVCGDLRIIDTATGNSVSVGVFPGGAEVDAFATTTGSPTDVLWLSEDPMSGVVSPDSLVTINVTFDTITYTVGTTVSAALRVQTDDNTFSIPVTMHVVNHTLYMPLVKKP